MVYNVLRRERPEPEGRASHRSVTDGGRGLLTVEVFFSVNFSFILLMVCDVNLANKLLISS
ncbi:MAG: hypothetical protein ACOCQG_01490 [Candidatus Nanoarchaeia archaeon]